MLRLTEAYEELEARGELWTPALLAGGLKCWVDAGDPSALTVSGSDVTTIRDRGLAASASRITDGPGYTANSIGSLPALQFTASPHERMVSDTSVAITLPFCAVMIFRPDSGSGNFARYFSFAASSGSDSGSLSSLAMMIRHNNTDVMATWFNNSLRAQTGMSNGVVNLCAVTIDASGNLKHYVNGALGDSNSLGGTPTWTSVKFLFGTQDQAGGNGSNNAPANMRLGEAMLWEGAQFETVHRLVEGYMAWRWRQVALLGAGHPYRSSPPLIGG